MISLVVVFCSVFCIAADPIVTTKYGTVYGWTYTSRDGTPVDIFQGIPFAKPPMGKLRFEKPQPPDRWFKPLTTQKYSDGCVPCLEAQRNRYGNVSEDCLYLNVWTPSDEDATNLPVMVYIHGGGFFLGQAYNLGAKNFADIYASKGVVVVTIQYRLAQFGFMTLNNTALPANLGMWDQNMALQWVNENIEYFKGDPKKVTIWGESAGAWSVSQHALSPHSRDLFQQTIQASGSAFGAIGDSKHSIEYTTELIFELGCSQNQAELKSCLQSKTVAEFQAAALKLNYCIAEGINSFPLTPIQDNDFWPANYPSLVTKENAKPTMVGLNQKEGRPFTLYDGPSMKPVEFPFAVEAGDWSSYNDASFRQFLMTFVTASGYSDKTEMAFNDIYKFYTRNKPADATYKYWIEQFVEVYSDFMFVVPTIRELVAKTAAGYPAYSFLLDHCNQATWPVDWPVQGSTHMGEFPYVFEMLAHFIYTDEDNAVKKTIQEGIIAFLKTGNPTTPAMKWYEFGSNLEYMSLQQNSMMKNGYFADSYNFWTKTMRKYDYDFITLGPWTN